jgi:hypothetical protein
VKVSIRVAEIYTFIFNIDLLSRLLYDLLAPVIQDFYECKFLALY